MAWTDGTGSTEAPDPRDLPAVLEILERAARWASEARPVSPDRWDRPGLRGIRERRALKGLPDL